MSGQSPAPREPHEPSGQQTHPDDEFIDGEPEPQRSNVPVVAMVIALAVLAITVGVVGYFVSGASDARPTPTVTPSAQPTGVPVLPQQIGDYQRQPGGGEPDPEAELMTASSIYVRDGQPALLVVAARPASDAAEQLTAAGARNIVEHDAAARCGRDENDLDICGVPYGNTVVLVEGLRDQEVQELVDLAREIAPIVG